MNSISLYDIIGQKFLLESKLNEYSKFFVLNMTNGKKDNIFSKIIAYSQKYLKFKTIDFISEKYFSKYKNIKCNIISSNEGFWKNSKGKINVKYDILSLPNNKIEENDIKEKCFLLNDEIIKSKKSNYNLTLKEKKDFVIKNVDKTDKIGEKKDIKKVYFDYINLLIMDNTNKDLIIKYLKFLKNNKNILMNHTELKYENYQKELEHYKFLFNQKELSEYFNIFGELSEKEKLILLLKEIKNINIENNSNIEEFLEKKYLELEDCYFFNQPIIYKNENLDFYRNRLLVLYSLREIKELKIYNKFKNMQYSCQEILNKNLFDKCKNKAQITFIIILIVSPQRRIITDYNINLINETNNIITKKKLISLGFKPKNDENKKIKIQIKMKKIKKLKKKIYLNLMDLNLIIFNHII